MPEDKMARQDDLPRQAAPPSLMPLTAKYEASSHAVYVNALDKSLKESRTPQRWNLAAHLANRWHSHKPGKPAPALNIALTGGYGVGKSSILQEIARRHHRKVVQVSLSTLGPTGAGGGQEDDPEAQTSLIQKEIVKQLLYREEPTKMPGSRFRRIGRFKKSRALGLAALVASILTVVFFLAGWTAKIAGAVPDFDPGLWVHLAIFVAAGLAAYVALAIAHDRIQIRQVKLADADISLAQGETSYFDQYLDEIVYFFDVTKRDIVILEDIDRFENPYVFETLRALNTLLNGAGQLRGRRIRFVYAIKDSIFVKIGKAEANEEAADLVEAEVERANRTKFFDLVVPVVPFITHRNARELMDDVLEGVSTKIDPTLIDLAARHVTDMRLMKNVRNEFIVFKSKVLRADDGGILDLNDNSLFAMMLYKSTHLEDFEKIKTGGSKLDDLYRAHAAITSRAIGSLNLEARRIRNQLSHIASAEGRSALLGDALLAYAERVGRHIGVLPNSTVTISLGGEVRSEDEVRAAEFWREFADTGGQLNIGFVANGVQRGQISITKDDAVTVFGADLESALHWDSANRESLEQRLKEISQTRAELAHADMDYLFEHDEYRDTSDRTFRVHAEQLESTLARELVIAGYIGRDFTLYTSSYYAGRVSTHARNFLMHHVDRNAIDANYALSAEEVLAIVAERGESVLREHGMYNTSVADCLFAAHRAGETEEDYVKRKGYAAIFARSLSANADDEVAFFDVYFVNGAEQRPLIQTLSRRWAGVFSLIMTRTELSDEERLGLFSSALEALGGEETYLASEPAAQLFIEQHIGAIPALTSPVTGVDAARKIAKNIAATSIKFSVIAPFGETVRQELIGVNAYKVSRENLGLVLSPDTIALDEIRDANAQVYDYVLSNLSDYVAAVRSGDGAARTVANGTELATIVADVAKRDFSRLAAVLDGAVPGATVELLSTVPTEAWPLLADRKQWPATLENVTAYIDDAGGLDDHLGGLLSDAGGIQVPSEAAQPELMTLAVTILAGSAVFPDPATRVDLVASLGLDEWVSPNHVPVEPGRLIGLLIASEVISDDAASYALALALDWPTREFAISESASFVSYMTPVQVPPGDVAPLIESQLVPSAVKDVILERAYAFVPVDDRVPLAALARYAESKGLAVPIPLVLRMAISGVGAAGLMPVLSRVLEQLDKPQLVSILTSLGGKYSALAHTGHDKPKLAATAQHRALLERLKVHGIVNTYSEKNSEFKVNKKLK